MNDKSFTISRRNAAAGALGLVLVTAAATYFVARRAGDNRTNIPDQHRPLATAPVGSPSSPAALTTASPADAPLPDVEIALSEEAIARAGITVNPAGDGQASARLRIPGQIEADAYRRVTVTSLVGGRLTRVNTELGEEVKRGSTMALIYSPTLAEAQTKYLSARAELEASSQELKRTERLVEIGAASRQELERVRAAHTTIATSVEGARAQLVLLGSNPASIARLDSPAAISATTSVSAPITGVVVGRQANVGLNVDPSTPLFTVVDLSTVWVVGDLYEKDFPRVKVGSEATITTTAYPGLAITGRVTYIDPQLNAETRTARVRVQVPNPRRELRLGMYTEVQIAVSGGTPVVSVPRDAVQTIGNRHFVYLAQSGQRGRFIEREVKLGDTTGDGVEIGSGLNAGDPVVTTGSFFLRAERERLGLRAAPGAAPAAAMPGMAMDAAPSPQSITIRIT